MSQITVKYNDLKALYCRNNELMFVTVLAGVRLWLTGCRGEVEDMARDITR